MRSDSGAYGFTWPAGCKPALNDWKPAPPAWRNAAPAMMLRAELPVQRRRTLKVW